MKCYTCSQFQKFDLSVKLVSTAWETNLQLIKDYNFINEVSICKVNFSYTNSYLQKHRQDNAAICSWPIKKDGTLGQYSGVSPHVL